MNENNSEDENREELERSLKAGDEVEGMVVHKAPFGDFIDIGVGFPALLEIIQMIDLTPDIYKEGKYNPIDISVKAYVAGFIDSPNKQIQLTKKTWVLEK